MSDTNTDTKKALDEIRDLSIRNAQRIIGLELQQCEIIGILGEAVKTTQSNQDDLHKHIAKENALAKDMADLVQIHKETKQGLIFLSNVHTNIVVPFAKFFTTVALLCVTAYTTAKLVLKYFMGFNE